ncbi:hypothetical protein R0135_00550 [Congregibacter variabilis]|uniref:DNA primase/polymerase bifunctional N-terminal domain-containing protein n=1 Tax=Congregibacter variabilis TaxID=3081200 RepID=A0ABZ0I2E7_9GAMM|nr:hypothetical protein R0135_00550 [Congregibacter sp. IMCC43200]
MYQKISLRKRNTGQKHCFLRPILREIDMAILSPMQNSAPVPLRPIFENFPSELTQADHWVLWKYELTDKGKWTKVPYTPQRCKASSTNPATWSPITDAVSAYSEGWASGVGIVLTQSLGMVALDFDGCTVEAAKPWLFSDSYTELSPSGNGVRQFIRGQLPEGAKNKYHPPNMKELEMYDSARYMTVTGHAL